MELMNTTINNGYIVLYFSDQVVIGKIVDENTVIYPTLKKGETEVEYHVFNQEIEIRGKGEFDFEHQVIHSTMGTVILDDDRDYFDEEMYIIGNKVNNHEITQYARKLVVPFDVKIEDGNHDFRIKVRHYFDDEGYISGYRLVDFLGGEIDG